ncbi:hypothetical protein [Candidatus Thiosymbion oneisti]|uniref:hypothetical protein n=1 Tax=Candidatus Thiosymbion oneisti TaxID=589554 RepID=UPI000B7D3B79|nr:hypothetical protein [Candidatus Thiosymbion oneisti]
MTLERLDLLPRWSVGARGHGRIECRLTGRELTRRMGKPQRWQVECVDGGVERPNAVGFADLEGVLN